MDIFTSISLNYLPKAQVLASSVKSLHPDWRFHVCISDRMPLDTEIEVPTGIFDNVIWVEDLVIENIAGWIFKHSIVEICTAVKGPVTLQLLQQGAEKLIYLDPDIAVFNSLAELDILLDQHAVLLTPHLLDPQDTDQAIADNEISALKHGVYNLGFFAVNNSIEGQKFAKWWQDRLLSYCYDDIPNGLFTDQKWCDLAPAFFQDLHILRDPGCNVASWNLSKRQLQFSEDGTILANGSPLKFYHFTGFDSGAGAVMTQRYAKNSQIVREIWNWYQTRLQAYNHAIFGELDWYFCCFENGDQIPQEARTLYRSRMDLQQAFPNPFLVGPNGGYWAWYKQYQSSKRKT